MLTCCASRLLLPHGTENIVEGETAVSQFKYFLRPKTGKVRGQIGSLLPEKNP